MQTLTEAEIRDAFTASLPAFRPARAYRFGLLIVTLAVLLLPLVYFALLLLVGASVYWYAQHAFFILEGRGATLYRLTGWVTPIVAGLIMILFMLKPLVARPAHSPSHLELDHSVTEFALPASLGTSDFDWVILP